MVVILILQIKKGKFGLYLLIGDDKTRNLKELGNRPLESIRYEEVIKLLEEEGESDIIREISDNIKIRKSNNFFIKHNILKKIKIQLKNRINM